MQRLGLLATMLPTVKDSERPFAGVRTPRGKYVGISDFF